MIRWILVFILLTLSLSFFLQNHEQEVTLRYLFGWISVQTKVYVPVLSGFVIGLLVSSILLFPGWIRGRIELRRKAKQLQEAQAELEQWRQDARGSGEPSRPSPPTERNPPT